MLRIFSVLIFLITLSTFAEQTLPQRIDCKTIEGTKPNWQFSIFKINTLQMRLKRSGEDGVFFKSAALAFPVSTDDKFLGLDFSDGDQVDSFSFNLEDINACLKDNNKSIKGIYITGYWWMDGDHVSSFDITCVAKF